MGRADMQIERQWFYVGYAPGTSTPARLPTDDRDKATGTSWVARARHPKDHHEYGIQAVFEGTVQDTTPKFVRDQLQHALDSYLADHPNGLDNTVMSV